MHGTTPEKRQSGPPKKGLTLRTIQTLVQAAKPGMWSHERGLCTHVVARLLRKMGYSLQVAQKQRSGAQHPDRDRQFKYIAELKVKFLREKLPVISIDTKKKELIGNYRREGKNWRREPIEVDAHFAGYS
jgi:hypothetical protein